MLSWNSCLLIEINLLYMLSWNTCLLIEINLLYMLSWNSYLLIEINLLRTCCLVPCFILLSWHVNSVIDRSCYSNQRVIHILATIRMRSRILLSLQKHLLLRRR
jgi:hypothetical protein